MRTRFAQHTTALTAALLCASLGGCPNNVNTGDAAGGAATQPSDQGDGDAAETVSFGNDIQPIFNTNCISCHQEGGVADQAGIALRLGSGESYGLLVNQRSAQNSNLVLVVPGDAEASLLLQKINSDAPPVGVRMPFGGAALSASEIELIRTWIAQGALSN